MAVSVETGPGASLASARLLVNGRAAATTAADGRAHLTLRGSEGEQVVVSVTCPEPYSPPPPLKVPLRRLAPGSREPTYRLLCAPQKRTVVVAVRATNGADLPVLYLGKEIARTDASGVAHAQLELLAGQRFELKLATTGHEPKLLPQDPSAVLVVGERDALLTVTQVFSKQKARSATATRRGPRPF